MKRGGREGMCRKIVVRSRGRKDGGMEEEEKRDRARADYSCEVRDHCAMATSGGETYELAFHPAQYSLCQRQQS